MNKVTGENIYIVPICFVSCVMYGLLNKQIQTGGRERSGTGLFVTTIIMSLCQKKAESALKSITFLTKFVLKNRVQQEHAWTDEILKSLGLKKK